MQRAGETVVLSRDFTDRDGTSATRYRACVRTVGRDPVVDTIYETDFDRGYAERLVVSERFVALFTAYVSTKTPATGGALRVALVDAASGRRLASDVSSGTWDTQFQRYNVLDAVIGPGGQLAWTEGTPEVSSLRTILDGELLVVEPDRRRSLTGLRFVGDVFHWAAGGEQRAHRLRAADLELPPGPDRCRRPRGASLEAAGARARVFRSEPGARTVLRACLRTSRRPPFPVSVGSPRRTFGPSAVLVDRERVLVVEHAAPDRWRLVTYDVRRRRATGPPVDFTAPADAVADAATAEGRVAIAIGNRVWLIGGGTARVVGEGTEPPRALWIDAVSVGWLEGTVSRSAPVRR